MNIHQAKRINRCKEITFALKRIGGANSAGKGKYYATMGHGTDPYSRESIDILGEERDIRDTGITPEQSKTVITAVLDLMARNVMRDGITRRFGNLFELRADITGQFERIDEPFDYTKHRLKLNLVPLKGLSAAYVREVPPVNERRMPKGRIDYVTYEGGDKGEVMVGSDIIIRGQDLYLDQGDSVSISWTKPSGYVERRQIGNWIGMEKYIKVNTPEELRIGWFISRPEDIVIKPGTVPKLFVDTHVARRNRYRGRGTASDIRILGL